MTALLGAPLPSGFHPSDFASLEPLSEKRGPCDSLISAPKAWIAQARIEVSASSSYLRRQAIYTKMIDACDISDSD